MKPAVQTRKRRNVSRPRRRPSPFAAGKQIPLGGSSECSQVPALQENGIIPRGRIRAYCAAIIREFHPQKIVLFGSYAYGQPTPDSDVDLLVILPFRGS